MNSRTLLCALLTVVAFLAAPIAASATSAAAPVTATPPATQSDTLGQALQLIQQKKYADAVTLLTDYLTRDPANYRALAIRGFAYSEMGKNAEALADFDASLAIEPNLESVHLAACQTLYHLHRLDESIAACSKAIDLNPQDANAYDARALSLDAKDDAVHEAAAIKDVDQAIALKPSAWSYAERCELKLELSQYDAAIPDCDQSLALDATNWWTWFQRGKLALHAGDFAGAATDFQKAIDNNTAVGYAYVSLAEAQYGLGKYPDALQSVNVYLAKFPKVSAALLIRAKVEAKLGKSSDARDDANAALASAQEAKSAEDTAAAQALLAQLGTKP